VQQFKVVVRAGLPVKEMVGMAFLSVFLLDRVRYGRSVATTPALKSNHRARASAWGIRSGWAVCRCWFMDVIQRTLPPVDPNQT
jgi:hypothetical protein